jgi:L-histidine N-alpha-methyltransferase
MVSERRWITPKRLTIHSLANSGVASSFADDVRSGLTSSPKGLHPKYFYDDLGSQLFEAICRLPEYYLTRAESEILSRYADEAISHIPSPVSLVELGSGSATKTRYLIDAIFRRQSELHYQPIDISPTALEASARDLLDTYTDLRITGYAGEYHSSLVSMRDNFGPRSHHEKILALFLGSNIGNFTPTEAKAFLQDVRQIMKPGDGLLLGADLKKDPAKLVAGYDDALGVTAAFNLNLLLRINRELEGDFDLSTFQHKAIYNEEQSRIEMHLVSKVKQSIPIKSLGIEIEFSAGESIHTENSYKFDHTQLATMADSARFKLTESWQDRMEQFSFNLFLAV